MEVSRRNYKRHATPREGLRNPQQTVHGVRVHLATTIESMLLGRGLTFDWLGEKLGCNGTTAARRIRNARITVQDVVDIEKALELRPGTLFRYGGVVPEESVTADYAIVSDERMPLKERHALATVVRAVLHAYGVDPYAPIRTMFDDAENEEPAAIVPMAADADKGSSPARGPKAVRPKPRSK